MRLSEIVLTMEPVSSNARVSVPLIHISTSLAWPTKRFTVDSGLDEFRPTFRPPKQTAARLKDTAILYVQSARTRSSYR